MAYEKSEVVLAEVIGKHAKRNCLLLYVHVVRANILGEWVIQFVCQFDSDEI